MVGVAGFEPTTFRSQSGRATKLRHTPSVRHVGYMAAGRVGCPLSVRGAGGPAEGVCGEGHDPLRCFPCRGPVTCGARACGRSSMVEPQSSKLATRVRFPSPAPYVRRPGPGRSPGRASRLAFAGPRRDAVRSERSTQS